MTVEILSKSDVVKFKKIHFMRNFVNNDDNEIALWCGRRCRNIVFHLGNNFPSGTIFQLIFLRDHPWKVIIYFLTLLKLFWFINPNYEGLKYWWDTYRSVVSNPSYEFEKMRKRELLFWITIYKNKVEQIPFRTLKEVRYGANEKKNQILENRKSEFMTFWIWKIAKNDRENIVAIS